MTGGPGVGGREGVHRLAGRKAAGNEWRNRSTRMQSQLGIAARLTWRGLGVYRVKSQHGSWLFLGGYEGDMWERYKIAKGKVRSYVGDHSKKKTSK